VDHSLFSQMGEILLTRIYTLWTLDRNKTFL